MGTSTNFLAPCGLYCGVCAVFYATRDKNEKFKDRFVGVYKGKLPGPTTCQLMISNAKGAFQTIRSGFAGNAR